MVSLQKGDNTNSLMQATTKLEYQEGNASGMERST